MIKKWNLKNIFHFVIILTLVVLISGVQPSLMPSTQTASYFITAKPKRCNHQQELSDLDCSCNFRDLPCRVPGSVCVMGFGTRGEAQPEMRCDCGQLYERELDKYCVEKVVIDPIDAVPEDPNPSVTVTTVLAPNFETSESTINPLFRIGAKIGSKKPVKKPPFKTVMVTSNPLYAVTRPSRFPRPSFPTWGVGGIGFDGPTIDSILANSFPRTVRPSLSPKTKTTGYQKGMATKRPFTRFFSRTTKMLPRADGSVVVTGWLPDLWPAVGLNYSI